MITKEERNRLASWLANHKPEIEAADVAFAIVARHAHKGTTYRAKLNRAKVALRECLKVKASDYVCPFQTVPEGTQ